MNETLITDLVSQEALDQLDKLDKAMEQTLEQFKDCAKELAKGLKIDVEVTGDLDKLKAVYDTQMQRANQAVQQLNQQLEEQQKVVANTTNTISRQLAEQEKLNKSQRAAFTQNQQALDIADRILGSTDQNYRQMAKYTAELKKNREAQKQLSEQEKAGLVNAETATQRRAGLLKRYDELKVAMQSLQRVLTNETKGNEAAEGSYERLSHELERLKQAQKQLNETEKSGEEGRILEAEIQNLDARLKDLAADMGEFQRNVGNYAIANGSLKKTYDQLTETLTALALQYNAMDEAQQGSDEGQALKAQIDKLTEQAALYKSTMAEVNDAVANSAAGQQITKLNFQLAALIAEYKRLSDTEKDEAKGQELAKKITDVTQQISKLKGEVNEVGNETAKSSLKKDLKEMTAEIASLTLEYQHMTAAEQESAEGQALNEKIIELTEKAGEYKDVLGDVKEAISNSASDTRAFDTIAEGGELVTQTFGLCTSAAQAFGLSEEDLTVTMAKVQAAMQASQAMSRVVALTQRQSNVMRGIAILQIKAQTVAENIKTAAEGKGVVATKAAAVAQALFNKVANANPYVLLAAAVLTVVGALVAFAKGSGEAAKKEEEAAEKSKQAAEDRKKSYEDFSQSVADGSAKQIASFVSLANGWNRLKSNQEKNEFIKKNREEMEKYTGATNDVGNAFADLVKRAPKVVDALMKVAVANAAAAVVEQKAQERIKQRLDMRTYTYTRYNAGAKVTNKQIEDYGLVEGTDYTVKKQIENSYDPDMPATYSTERILTKAGAVALSRANQEKAWAENQKKIQAFDKQTASYLSAAVNYAYDAAEDASAASKAAGLNGEYGQTESDKGGSSSSSKGGRSGSHNSSSGSGSSGSSKNTETVKSAEEIKREVDGVVLQAVKGQAEVAIEGTEEWSKFQKEALRQQADLDRQTAADTQKKELAELEKSHKAKKISEADYQKRKADLENSTAQTVKNINDKLAADLQGVDEKVLAYKQKVADDEIEQVLSEYASEQVMRDAKYQDDMNALKENYAQQLTEAGGNAEKIAAVKEKYEARSAALSEKYAKETAQAEYDLVLRQLEAIGVVDEDMITEISQQIKDGELDAAATTLEAYGLTHDKAVELLKSLATTETALRTTTTDSNIAQAERQNKTEEELADEREKRMQKYVNYLQKAQEAVSNLSDFVTTMYDNQINGIEEALNAEQERYDKEVENIEYLAERGAITSEEAEIRKRDAAAATEAKQEQLEKKKAKLEYKKAVVEKANSIAQIGIATALGIMQALPNIPLAVFVGAMGAIQVATALAQPIKAYKEGTKGRPHPGGLALVGEGGNAELVTYNGKAWVTPDKPTLLDLPRGAEVFPDATKEDLMRHAAAISHDVPRDTATGQPVIINDYQALEALMATNTKVMRQELRSFSKSMSHELRRQRFRDYINRRT